MALGRPPKADSGYHVSTHRIGNYVYASTQPVSVDQNGKKTYKYKHWGRLEGNRFIPGTEFILLSQEERKKLVFPKDWDLSEIDRLFPGPHSGRPSQEGQDSNRLYGVTWFLEQVAEKTGITKDLMTVFGGNRIIVNDILTLAMFPYVAEGLTYNRLRRHQRIFRFPSDRSMGSDYIARLTQSITEQNRMDLFRLRAARLGKDSILAVDSTSRSAYGQSLSDIRWGKNKDHVPLKQTAEVVAYTLNEHMPVYYRTFPGNTPDSRSLQIILTDLSHAGFEDAILVTDRGYESVRNLETYIAKGQAMIMCAKVSQSLIAEKIGEFGNFDEMARPEQMELDTDTLIYYRQYDVDYQVSGTGQSMHNADRLKINIYLDPAQRSSELVIIDADIKTQREALTQMLAEGAICDDDATLKRVYSYFEVCYDNVSRQILSFSENEKKIQKARRFAGIFSIIIHKLDFSAMETFRHYKLRDEQEKYFHQMKGQMGFDKQRNWSEDGKNGRLLVLFVSLVLSSYVKHIWQSTDLKDEFDSSLAVLDEMKPIRIIEHTGRAKRITPFIGSQVDICQAYGFKIPEGCAPQYTSKKKAPKRRGRPARKQVILEE